MARVFRKRSRYGYGVPRVLRNTALAVMLSTGALHAQQSTILALGDSLTAGYGLPREQGFVPQLANWLGQQGVDVKLINAGVSGSTTAGGLSRVGWSLSDDVDGMIVALGGNDYLRGIDPKSSRENLDRILAKGQEAGVQMLLVGIIAGGNFGAEYKREFNDMYEELAAKYKIPLIPDFYTGLKAAAKTQSGMAQYMQPDGIHPNRQGVAEIIPAIGPEVYRLVRPEN
ncbi:arylesterase [Neptunicoccus cionae]|uniref:Arylesterase n=1 Tax=Neptunicoccus cionae TaxID=2035344 RepID=A0A916QXV7_9RHOB|nr:arylesterase [Amylibacter cionae]GGA19036.1 arylesterase [Amylibacter cionae]